MTKKHYGLISLVILAVISIINCGGGGGAPGSSGSGDTGIMIQAANLTLVSPDIDTFQCSACCGATATTPGTPEPPLTRESATLNVETLNLNPDVTTAQFPATVTECTITYLKSNQDPAAPIIEDLVIYPECILTEGTNSCPVTLIDITRKLQYSDAVIVNKTSVPSEYPTHYVVQYNCTYINNFGQTGYFQTEVDIWLADFLKC